MALSTLIEIFETCTTEGPRMPPTLLYNEGWLLRLVLHWFSKHRVPEHPLDFSDGARWFSESLLPSAFAPRHRGDRLSEARTHLDGAIGHFRIGSLGKADLSLQPDATQFIALEAKLFSGLSAKVKNSGDFDQAARNVACVAEVLRRANLPPDRMRRLAFYVLAPSVQIERGIFDQAIERESIKRKVEQRVAEYGATKDSWYTGWFWPAIQRIEIALLSWEGLLATIQQRDSASASAMGEFYERCVEFNVR